MHRVGCFWGGDGERVLRINVLGLSATPSAKKAQSRVRCSQNAPHAAWPTGSSGNSVTLCFDIGAACGSAKPWDT